jgi:hypothetical protein
MEFENNGFSEFGSFGISVFVVKLLFYSLQADRCSAQYSIIPIIWDFAP